MPGSPPIIDADSEGPARPRVVLAHDWLCGLRGGEHVLERIATMAEREFETAGQNVMLDDGQTIGPTVDNLVSGGDLVASWMNDLSPTFKRLRRWLLPLYPLAVKQLSWKLGRLHARKPIDLVISTSSAAIKGLRPPRGVPHLCVCFSPARYVWGERELYQSDGSLKGWLRSLGLWMFGGTFRAWDKRTASNVTQFVAISSHIQARIRKAYGVDSVIIHPPVRTNFFTLDPSVPREDFWLCVGALESYKRADLAIEAAQQAGARIKVVGEGSQSGVLRRRYGSRPNVEFLGRVSDEVLRDLYRRARLLIFPQVEDFGIVAVEAQACGLPVLALARGGSVDIIVDGRTGELVNEANPEAFAQGAERVPRNAEQACRENSLRFSEEAFERALLSLVASLLAAKSASSPR